MSREIRDSLAQVVDQSREIRAAHAEVGAWFRSGNSVPIELGWLMKTKGPTKVKADIERLMAAALALADNPALLAVVEGRHE